jgi:transposase
MKPEDELIQVRADNETLRAQLEQYTQELAQRDELIAQLQQRLHTLEERLAKDSHNSHLPPSSHRFVRQPKSLRTKSGKKPGGQAGHPGQSLRFSATPDEVVVHEVQRCHHCQQDLHAVVPLGLERRQVIDVPSPRLLIREHQTEQKVCPQCQHLSVAPFPEEARAPVQYGPTIGAMAVYVVQQHLVPLARATEVLEDLLGVSMSQATLCSLIERCARDLQPIEELTKTALSLSEVVHQDETGLYVGGKRSWMHVTATATLTHDAVHAARGVQALQAIGILESFAGVSVHDGWKSYWQYECGHALCNVHILRDLTFVEEEHHQSWAGEMKEVLLSMKAHVEDARASGQNSLPFPSYRRLVDHYRRLLLHGYLCNLPDPLTSSPSPPKRGRRKQSAALNLLDRLWEQEEAGLAFLYDFAVPFDNSQAERDLRMVKVQQKVSGCFRSGNGARHFARIPGYLSTLRKQGVPLLSALQATLLGHPILPSFSAT